MPFGEVQSKATRVYVQSGQYHIILETPNSQPHINFINSRPLQQLTMVKYNQKRERVGLRLTFWKLLREFLEDSRNEIMDLLSKREGMNEGMRRQRN